MVVCLSHTVLHHATTMLVLATVGSIHTWGLAYARAALVAQSVESKVKLHLSLISKRRGHLPIGLVPVLTLYL